MTGEERAEELAALREKYDHALFLAYWSARVAYQAACAVLDSAYDGVRAGGGCALLDQAVTAEAQAYRALQAARTEWDTALPSVRAGREGAEVLGAVKTESLLELYRIGRRHSEGYQLAADQRFRIFAATERAHHAEDRAAQEKKS